MGIQKLSQAPLSDTINNEDSIIGVFNNKLGRATVAQWLSKLNSNLNVSVISDTEEEYILSISVGNNTIITPNLKTISLTNAEITKGHLYLHLSDGRIIDAGIVNSDVKKYGVCYDFKSKNPKLTRLGDAKYLKAGIANGVDDTNVVNDFDKVYPWCDIKRCTRADDGTITSYEGDPNYTENGSIGQTMTEIPEHYRMTYISEATGKIYHYVSREKLNEYYKYVPKTYIGSFLISNENDGVGRSCGGDFYPGKLSYQNARNAAEFRGTGWHMMDIWDYETVKTLFMIEFATVDSQSIFRGNELGNPSSIAAFADEECMMDELYRDTPEVTDTEFQTTSIVLEMPDLLVGDEIDIVTLSNENPGELDYEYEGEYGAIRKITAIEPIDVTSYPDAPDAVICHISGNAITVGKTFECYLVTSRNGQTNDIKASSGRLLRYENGDGEPPSEGSSVWRGIENLVGEGYTWLDGILLHDNKYWVCEDPSKYANTIYAYDEDGIATEEYQYKPLSFNYPTAQGYITKMGYDEETGLTLPVETGGTSDTGYCDNFNKPRNLNSFFTVRYGGTYSATAGLFHLSCYLPAPYANQYSARLSYRHY